MRRAVATLLLGGIVAAPLTAQPPPAWPGAVELGLTLRRLGTTARIVMIGAHPDDESTPLLAELALRQGARVTYLSLTRGEGGQNSLGPEAGPVLGLLRTGELLAARRLDGAAQRFGPAIDFGFSKSASETWRHWPRDTLQAIVAALLDELAPDVVVSVFRGEPSDGHGHHQAAGQLARAVVAARPPERRPVFLLRSGGDVCVAVGERDPLLGRSPYQVAMASRSQHRSQDQGRPQAPGPQSSCWARAPESGAGPVRWRVPLAERLGAAPPEARAMAAAYDAWAAALPARAPLVDPAPLVPELAAWRARLRALPTLDAEARRAVAEELDDLTAALLRAANVALEATVARAALAPDDTATLALAVWNGGRDTVIVEGLAPVVPPGWQTMPLDPPVRVVAPGTRAVQRWRLHLPSDAAPSQPYFLRAPRRGDLYAWPPGADGAPLDAALVAGRQRLHLAGETIDTVVAAYALQVDPRDGEREWPVYVAPRLGVALPFDTLFLPTQSRPFTLTLRLWATGPGRGRLEARLPSGWRMEPAAPTVVFAAAGEQRLTVRLVPPARLPEGTTTIAFAVVTADGARVDGAVRLVDHPHIAPVAFWAPARLVVRAAALRRPAGAVGLLVTPDDDTPERLAALGLTVERIDPAAATPATLARFRALLVGPRAYERLPGFAAARPALLAYVRAGGTLILQYQREPFFRAGWAPLPLEVAQPADRVTDETAPVRLLAPDHPALRTPHRIGPEDFLGWVQERALMVPRRWDPAYQPLLEMADPGEPPLRGTLLVARYGRGHIVYTGLALFRQLPAGVPGAWRLLLNLLALRP